MFELIKSLTLPIFFLYFIANRMVYQKYMDIQGLQIDKKLIHLMFENFLFSNSENIKIKYMVIFANIFRTGFFISLLFNAISTQTSLSQVTHQFIGNLFMIVIVIMTIKSLYDLGKQISTVYQEREIS